MSECRGTNRGHGRVTGQHLRDQECCQKEPAASLWLAKDGGSRCRRGGRAKRRGQNRPRRRPIGLRAAANLGPEQALPAKRWRSFGKARWTEANTKGALLRSWTLQQTLSVGTIHRDRSRKRTGVRRDARPRYAYGCSRPFPDEEKRS